MYKRHITALANPLSWHHLKSQQNSRYLPQSSLSMTVVFYSCCFNSLTWGFSSFQGFVFFCWLFTQHAHQSTIKYECVFFFLGGGALTSHCCCFLPTPYVVCFKHEFSQILTFGNNDLAIMWFAKKKTHTHTTKMQSLNQTSTNQRP